MPRDGAGVYSKVPGTEAVSGNAIDSTDYNATVDDLVVDANVERPITAGGTGENNAVDALAALGGQPLDPDLSAIGALGFSARSMMVKTAANTWSLTPSLAYGESLLNVASEAAFKALVNLEIGVDVQAYDADLATWAGVTPSANGQSLVSAANYAAMRALLDLEAGVDFNAYSARVNALVALAGGADLLPYMDGVASMAQTTFTSFARQILDDANAGAVLTTLGLTANGQSLVTAANYAAMRALLDLEAGTDFLAYSAFSANGISLVGAANYAAMRALLDLEAGTDFYSVSAADTLLAAKAALASANTFTANQVIDRSAASNVGNLRVRGGGSGFVRAGVTVETDSNGRGAGYFVWDDANDVEYFFGAPYNDSGSPRVGVFRRTSVTSFSADSATANPASATELASFYSTGFQARLKSATTESGTLVAADANTVGPMTAGITNPNSVFSANDIVARRNNTAGALTLTQGAGMTQRLAGTSTTGNLSVAARGKFQIEYVSASESIVSGDVS